MVQGGVDHQILVIVSNLMIENYEKPSHNSSICHKWQIFATKKIEYNMYLNNFFILYYNKIGILNHLKIWIFIFHFIYLDQMGSIFNKSSN
jgi:hypothetical protein